jgi:hypothetical protein
LKIHPSDRILVFLQNWDAPGDTYFGLLQYQETKGWQGSAFSQLPLEMKEQLKKFEQSSYALLKVAA